MHHAVGWLEPDEPIYNKTRLQQHMRERDLDAVVVRSGQNMTYLSGMRLPGTLGRHQDFAWSPRPVMVVWPRDGPAMLTADAIGADLAAVSSWIEDIRTYATYEESPWGICAAYLEELGIDDGRVGIERREVSVDQWTMIENLLFEAELVDCTATMDSVRNVKTDGELALLREAVAIQDAAHLKVFGEALPGVTERELHARMIESMLRQGAEWGHGMMQSDNTDIIYGGEGPVRVTDRDVVKTDYVCYVNRYAANLSRMAIMGRPSSEQKKNYQELLEIHHSLIDEVLRPGVSGGEVWSALRDRLHDRGYTNVAGLAGHSTGVWWHQEQPILRPGEETQLQQGMVICLEPIIEKFWHIQDQILITKSGAEVLSDGFDIDDMFIMG